MLDVRSSHISSCSWLAYNTERRRALVYAQRASLIAFFVVAVWSRLTLGGERELKLGQIRETSLSPGQTQSFVVSLGDGDFAQIGVNPRGQALVVKTYDPSGKPFRGTELGPEDGKLNFVAPHPTWHADELIERVHAIDVHRCRDALEKQAFGGEHQGLFVEKALKHPVR